MILTAFPLASRCTIETCEHPNVFVLGQELHCEYELHENIGTKILVVETAVVDTKLLLNTLGLVDCIEASWVLEDIDCCVPGTHIPLLNI